VSSSRSGTATIVEVVGGVREYEIDGRAVLEAYPVDQICDGPCASAGGETVDQLDCLQGNVELGAVADSVEHNPVGMR
jgi:hypothetical protein